MIDLITTKEAAGILGCAQRTVNEYIRRGKILPSQKVKGKHLLEKEKVLNLLYHNLSSSKNSYFNPCFKSSFEKRNLTDIIDKWQIHSRDTSSADVQIGIYTEKIKQLEVKMVKESINESVFKKMRYDLLRYVGERRRLLKYLEISDYRRYKKALDLIRKESDY